MEEATKVLARYHGEGDESHPIVVLQLKEMQNQIRQDASDKKGWDYSELVNTQSARRRLICVLGMACFGQLCHLILPSGHARESWYHFGEHTVDDEWYLSCHLLLRSDPRSPHDRCRRSQAAVALLDSLLFGLFRNHLWY